MEPRSGSPDGYEGSSNNAPIRRYDREVYPMDNEDHCPPSPCASTSLPLQDEMRYVTKYLKQHVPSDYLPEERPALYPNGTSNDQVQLQTFPDVAAELSRRANNVEGTLQDGSYDSVGSYGRVSGSSTLYRRNYDEHHFQSSKFQDIDVNNPYNIVLRQPYQESEACTNQLSFSGAVSQRRYPNSFLDDNRTPAMGLGMHQGSPSVQHLKFQPGCDKPYPVNDSMNIQRMYHHSSQKINSERFNLANGCQGFPMSSGYDNTKLQKPILQSPQQQRSQDQDLPPEDKPSPSSSDVSDLPILSSISRCPLSSANCFYSKRPALEHLVSRASEHIEAVSHRDCQDKDMEKISESYCSMPEGSELLHSQQDNHNMELKNKVFQDQMPFLTPSKPAGPNGLF